MMSIKQSSVTNHIDGPKFLTNPPLTASFHAGWNNIQLVHYHQPSIDVPEMANSQHMVIIPLGHEAVDFELSIEGCKQTVSYREEDYSGCIEIYPADLHFGLRSHATVKTMEVLLCYIEPNFLAQTAYELTNSDRIKLLQTPKKVDLLIYQIGLALKASLEVDGVGSRFYADSMATALSAHLLRHYSTCSHAFRDYQDGLSKQKLKQAVEYIQAHLGEDLSLSAIANELGMSQYYFCRLFKKSTGVSPHQYLIQQRVEKAKHLLKQSERTITSVAMDCGFANQSHFAKCFHQCTGMNPKQFCKT
jgi:AraC family transcriptional regulator